MGTMASLVVVMMELHSDDSGVLAHKDLVIFSKTTPINPHVLPA